MKFNEIKWNSMKIDENRWKSINISENQCNSMKIYKNQLKINVKSSQPLPNQWNSIEINENQLICFYPSSTHRAIEFWSSAAEAAACKLEALWRSSIRALGHWMGGWWWRLAEPCLNLAWGSLPHCRSSRTITPIAWALMRAEKINDYSEVEHDFENRNSQFYAAPTKIVTLGQDRSIDTQIRKWCCTQK